MISAEGAVLSGRRDLHQPRLLGGYVDATSSRFLKMRPLSLSSGMLILRQSYTSYIYMCMCVHIHMCGTMKHIYVHAHTKRLQVPSRRDGPSAPNPPNASKLCTLYTLYCKLLKPYKPIRPVKPKPLKGQRRFLLTLLRCPTHCRNLIKEPWLKFRYCPIL